MIQLRNQLALIITVGTLVGGCSSPLPPEPQRGAKLVDECPSRTSEAYYLPADALNPGIDDVRRRNLRGEYSRFLANADALPLWCGGTQPAAGAFRLLWVPAGRPARLIEIVEGNDDWNGRMVVFGDGLKGEDVHRVVTSRNIKSSKEDGQTFANALQKRGLWTVSAWVGEFPGSRSDGAEWIAEARSNSTYRLIRRERGSEDALEEIAQSFFNVAGETMPVR